MHCIRILLYELVRCRFFLKFILFFSGESVQVKGLTPWETWARINESLLEVYGTKKKKKMK